MAAHERLGHSFRVLKHYTVERLKQGRENLLAARFLRARLLWKGVLLMREVFFRRQEALVYLQELRRVRLMKAMFESWFSIARRERVAGETLFARIRAVPRGGSPLSTVSAVVEKVRGKGTSQIASQALCLMQSLTSESDPFEHVYAALGRAIGSERGRGIKNTL